MQERVWRVGEQVRQELKHEPPHYMEMQFGVFDLLNQEEDTKLDELSKVVKYAPAFREWVLHDDVPPETKNLIAQWEHSVHPEQDGELVEAIEKAFLHWYKETTKSFSPELRSAYEEAITTQDPDKVSEVWRNHMH